MPDPSPTERRTAGDWCFYRFEEQITSLPPAHGARAREACRAAGREPERWEVEACVNHQHPDHGVTRESVRAAVDMAADLGRALEQAWPERRFTVECRLGADYVTFYQPPGPPPSAPVEIGDAERMRSAWFDDPALTWCDRCGGGRPFTPVTEPDTEFPMVGWARCRECEAEWVLRTRTVRFQIGPGIAQPFRMGAYTGEPEGPICRTVDRVPF